MYVPEVYSYNPLKPFPKSSTLLKQISQRMAAWGWSMHAVSQVGSEM